MLPSRSGILAEAISVTNFFFAASIFLLPRAFFFCCNQFIFAASVFLLPGAFFFCRDQFLFCRRHFSFAGSFFLLPWHLWVTVDNPLHTRINSVSNGSTQFQKPTYIAWKVSVCGISLAVFFHIWTESGEILSISPYSFQMRENTHQKKSEYGHSSRSVKLLL